MRRFAAIAVLMVLAVAALSGCGGESTASKVLDAQSEANAVASVAHTNADWARARADLAAYCVIHPSGDQGADGVAAVDAVAKMIEIAKRAPDGQAPDGGTYRSGLADEAASLMRCDEELSAYARLGLETLD